MTNILLIEPNRILAQIYREAFEQKGYKVSLTHDAQNAISASDKQRPDIVILELQLIKHNGVEFLYELRSYADWQKIPVIINSIVPPSEFAQNEVLFKEIGVIKYLYKPKTSLSVLLRVVDQALKSSLQNTL